MVTLRRILKYTPAVVIGLLVVAWMVSVFSYSKIAVGFGRHFVNAIFGIGSLSVSCWKLDQPTELDFHSAASLTERGFSLEQVSGYMRFGAMPNSNELFALTLPFPLTIVAFLPLAVGPFISFRFRLWHYLAYTALVALELAYYLRWQG
jgi:hypothetical protein